MSLLNIALVIIVIGVLLWLATKFIPMDPTIKTVLIAVVVIGLVWWLLKVTGLLDRVDDVEVGSAGHTENIEIG